MKERAQIFAIILIVSTILGFVITSSLVNLKSPYLDITGYFGNRFYIVWAVISLGLVFMFAAIDSIIELTLDRDSTPCANTKGEQDEQ